MPLHPTKAPVERRDHTARKALVTRIRSELEEQQGMCLTVGQASRLCGIPLDTMARIFGQLVEDEVVRQTRDGRYRR